MVLKRDYEMGTVFAWSLLGIMARQTRHSLRYPRLPLLRYLVKARLTCTNASLHLSSQCRGDMQQAQ